MFRGISIVQIIFLISVILVKAWSKQSYSNFQDANVHYRSPYSFQDSSKESQEQFSTWELRLMNELLVDITINSCEKLYPDNVEEFKTYIGKIVENAPKRNSVNLEFTLLYDAMLKCYRESVSKSDNKKKIEQESKVKFINRSTEPPPVEKVEKTKKKQLGIIKTVGNLFEKLYDNTINIFDSVFGRKKRNSYYNDSEEEEENYVEVTEKPRKRFYSKSKSSHNKRIFDKNENNERTQEKSTAWTGMENPSPADAFHRQVFVNMGQQHFQSVIKSFVMITKRSCPASVYPHTEAINSGIKQILQYIKKDMMSRAEKENGQRDQFPLDYVLQQKTQECSKSPVPSV